MTKQIRADLDQIVEAVFKQDKLVHGNSFHSEIKGIYIQLTKSQIRTALERFVVVEKDRWISVDERLPEKDGNSSISCLCYDSYHRQKRVLVYNEFHKVWDEESGDDYYTDAIGGKVTHWMPLPPKPTQKGGEDEGK